MPNGTTTRRALLSATALAALLATQGASAQFRDGQPALVDDAASSSQLAVDRRLAEQYAEQYSAPAPGVLPAAPADAVPLPPAAGFDEAAAANLEKEIEAALAEAAAENKEQEQRQPAKRVFVATPSPWRTSGLIIGALALLGLVSVVLTLAVRELRQDAKQRRRTYRRRRMRRREPVETVTASAN